VPSIYLKPSRREHNPTTERVGARLSKTAPPIRPFGRSQVDEHGNAAIARALFPKLAFGTTVVIVWTTSQLDTRVVCCTTACISFGGVTATGIGLHTPRISLQRTACYWRVRFATCDGGMSQRSYAQYVIACSGGLAQNRVLVHRSRELDCIDQAGEWVG
jgi:hypothetical protein